MTVTLSDQLIDEALRPYHVPTAPALRASIRAYIELLLRWNQRIALTTITDPAEILRLHFGESMFAVNEVPIRHGRLADVGRGAASPPNPSCFLLPWWDC